MRGRINTALIAAAIAASIGALPDLGQQRALRAMPGSGITVTTRRKRRKDLDRQQRAEDKRARKNALRLKHWQGGRVVQAGQP